MGTLLAPPLDVTILARSGEVAAIIAPSDRYDCSLMSFIDFGVDASPSTREQEAAIRTTDGHKVSSLASLLEPVEVDGTDVEADQLLLVDAFHIPSVDVEVVAHTNIEELTCKGCLVESSQRPPRCLSGLVPLVP